ncbi:MAG: cobyric acid synthase [Pyrinomonadaceae bacterium]
MILGTASHVGKSLIVAAFCRIFAQDGYRVAPFKAQNMALNSAATPDGLEIGRAQALQAEAAGIAPTVDMNPVLIKPSSDTGAQVVVRGSVWGQVTASDYHQRRTEELFPIVIESYRRLARAHDIIVLEGAGSPAEINLKKRDIVNMRMAEVADAACVLVGDIDRGGVFASLLGTIELLEHHERSRIHGLLINKFRGDMRLLTPGVEMIESRVGKACYGVIPFIKDLGLEEEDSVALEEVSDASIVWRRCDDTSKDRPVRVGVIRFPFLSNFTDFDALSAEATVDLAYISHAEDIAKVDLLILPGSKQTIADLRWLKESKIASAISNYRIPVIGICGGMQMLGHEIKDVGGLEGGGTENGLGLLPIKTYLGSDKATFKATARLLQTRFFGNEMTSTVAAGYEIHLGKTEYDAGEQPLFELTRQTSIDRQEKIFDGAISPDTLTIGSYLHGLFDTDDFRHSILSAVRVARGLNPAPLYSFYSTTREARLDRLAEVVRNSINLTSIYDLLSISR